MKSIFNFKKLIVLISLLVIIIALILVYLFFNSSLTQVQYVTVCNKNINNCQPTNLAYQNSKLPIDTRVDDLISRMTVAEKIGQMALIEKNSIHDLNDIAKYGLGALMSGSGGKPNDNTPAGWLAMVNNFQSYSQKTRLAIPLLYGVDANHGNSNVPGATIFPHFIGLGASHDPALVAAVAKATAEEVAATGIYWAFSPDLDVVRDIRWGRTYETFGSDPKIISSLGQAYIKGLQSVNQNGLTITATAKHYLGNGSTIWGSSTNKNYFIDQGNSNISEADLRNIDLEPFKQAVNAQVKVIMVGLNKWNGEKISANKYLLTDILRGELGFPGIVVSDWYGIYNQESDQYQALVQSIKAGVDLVMLPYDYKTFTANLQRAAANGDLSQTRLDEAVSRILKVKFEIGLFDNLTTDSSQLKNVGSAEHRELARQAVRESQVLLKNNQAVPISKSFSKLLVAGTAANNLGQQAGGWTVEWQGIDGNWLAGTTILQGIESAVDPTTKVEYNPNGSFSGQSNLAEVGIAVVGEKPYAEGWGDNAHPQLSTSDLQTINNLKKYCKKIIVIIVSGRPLDIQPYAKDWDAIIAAWLPGSEGEGVADVLFGDFPFTGTLPVGWNF